MMYVPSRAINTQILYFKNCCTAKIKYNRTKQISSLPRMKHQSIL